MITRKQYMEDSTNLHNAYYQQFATEKTYQILKSDSRAELLRKCRASSDYHFNDIYSLAFFDSLAAIARPTFNKTLLKETGENYSLSTGVCIIKCVIRKILEESSNV